ncbi:threonine/serine exporter family protein [Stigmatella sp. ncwal1]|uniref:Threonine/serine exporter family protein n=1 Tax=Stigmatella ashevillensis TaxID=2995309 RepID=A0ABT5DI16_9BACT|nr:threonine/serine exporter family protein [Stigmatella ashevillena]MDC0713166.1 threonine/serine exporter family protein [Stigmatella ashevillena]
MPPDHPSAFRETPPGPVVAFILRLGKALHQYGTPAHRLEEQLRQVSERFDVEARFFSTPTSIFASFGAPELLQTSLIRVEPGEMDLERLTLLDALTYEVIHHKLSPELGTQRVEAILQAPPRYGLSITLLCWVLAAGAAARLFGGGPREMCVAGLSSLSIGVLDQVLRRGPRAARVLESAAALLSSVLAVAAASIFGPLSVQVATLSGLIVLLPGLGLTVAINELATRNLISGTSRLTGAVLVFLQLTFGVALGGRLAGLLPEPPPALSPLPLPFWTVVGALVVVALAVTVLFRARPEDIGWIVTAGALAFGGARWGAQGLGTELGAFVGALLLGMASNAMARLRNRPAVVTLVPGMMLLVPGSLGFRSLESLLARDVVTGIGTAFSMLLIAVAIAVGLLFANALVPSRRVL